MSKKTEKRGQQKTEQDERGISATGKKVIAAGILVAVAGYFVLTKTDPAGQNWASTLSPFLILGGYVLIGAGIIVPEKPADIFDKKEG
ncbi:MAG: hypothetical protein JW803_02475 [Endomicrobiales bacterium]|nr:hypothetical protein [Endomicrobiales bacterium]